MYGKNMPKKALDSGTGSRLHNMKDMQKLFLQVEVSARDWPQLGGKTAQRRDETTGTDERFLSDYEKCSTNAYDGALDVRRLRIRPDRRHLRPPPAQRF